MTTLKAKAIREMSKADREKKIAELKMEMIKSQANASKSGSSRVSEIRKIIARILTINKAEEKTGELKSK